MVSPWAECKFINPGRQKNLPPALFMEVMPIAKKNPIVKVKFSYVGTEDDFVSFLKAVVRDHLALDDIAADPNAEIVEKVESDAA